MVGLTDLPAELVSEIGTKLNLANIKNLRLVCKTTSQDVTFKTCDPSEWRPVAQNLISQWEGVAPGLKQYTTNATILIANLRTAKASRPKPQGDSKPASKQQINSVKSQIVEQAKLLKEALKLLDDQQKRIKNIAALAKSSHGEATGQNKRLLAEALKDFALLDSYYEAMIRNLARDQVDLAMSFKGFGEAFSR